MLFLGSRSEIRSAESTFPLADRRWYWQTHTLFSSRLGVLVVCFPPGIILPSPLLLLKAPQILEAQFKLIFLQETCLDWTRHSSSAFLSPIIISISHHRTILQVSYFPTDTSTHPQLPKSVCVIFQITFPNPSTIRELVQC